MSDPCMASLQAQSGRRVKPLWYGGGPVSAWRYVPAARRRLTVKALLLGVHIWSEARMRSVGVCVSSFT